MIKYISAALIVIACTSSTIAEEEPLIASTDYPSAKAHNLAVLQYGLFSGCDLPTVELQALGIKKTLKEYRTKYNAQFMYGWDLAIKTNKESDFGDFPECRAALEIAYRYFPQLKK